MPEIKHQFTGGKMNKDLDERLIPNGQYRDAFNVQVSTSEGSDVGTVQNLLSNNLVTGQAFVKENTVCVGAVANERNDKLYWFISPPVFAQGINLNGLGGFELNNTSSGFGKDGWLFIDNKAVAATPDSVASTHAYKINKNNIEAVGPLKEGQRFEINFTLSDYVKGSLEFKMFSSDGLQQATFGSAWMSQHFSKATSSKDFTFGTKIKTRNNAIGSSFRNRAWLSISDTQGNDNFIGKISDYTISGGSSMILEYNTTTNVVKPVLIDINNDVLKLSPTRLITGINIIDDMLFWTDGFSEPKKINITNCIKGTRQSIQQLKDSADNLSSSDLLVNLYDLNVHTLFINEKTNIQVPIKEEHITVLKKSPQKALSVDLISKTDIDIDYSGALQTVNSGIMKITAPPVPKPTPGASNFQNINSSFWKDPASVSSALTYNHHYDWSQLNVGDKFRTRIETDVNGNSGFQLSWKEGDVILFKEFLGATHDEAPPLPLTQYAIKAAVMSSSSNNFSDEVVELAPDMSIPNSTGDLPMSWERHANSNANQVFWNSGNLSFVWDTNTQWRQIRGFTSEQIAIGGRYRLTYTVEAAPSGAIQDALGVTDTMVGSVYCSLMVKSDRFNATYGTNYASNIFHRFYPMDSYVFAPGTYSEEFDITPYHMDTFYPAGDHTNTWFDQHGGQDSQIFLSNNSNSADPDGVNCVVKDISVERLDVDDAYVKLRVLAKNENIPAVPVYLQPQEIKFVADLQQTDEKIFKFKFPRFAYRYKYQDGEYSAISPFTPAAFLAGAFDYHPTKGYNLAMSNRIQKIKLGEFNRTTPDGVVEIDLIYKEDKSPMLYVVDTFTPNGVNVGSGIDGASPWAANQYIIDSEQINNAIESNQLLRPHDNVPKRALAQEVTGSRIVYGNYTQGFDLKTGNQSLVDYKPNFEFDILSFDNTLNSVPSVKSLREYQIGVVFVDKYGRETPVVSNTTGTSKLNKEEAAKQNKVLVSFKDNFSPQNYHMQGSVTPLYGMKFFIKETSGGYYNMAMDRFYDAEDGQIWLSFPSSDRNKVTIDDFLILKKGVESNDLVTEEAKYKVLDIVGEAPEFIKIEKSFIQNITHRTTSGLSGGTVDVFGATGDGPLVGRREFKLNYEPFTKSTGGNLHEIEEKLFCEFIEPSSGTSSKRYKINSITTNRDVDGVDIGDAVYTVFLDETLGDDISFITNDPTGVYSTAYIEGIEFRVYKALPENSARFDGRFFVKINNDSTVNQQISASALIKAESVVQYRVVEERRIYSMRPEFKDQHNAYITGQKHGVYKYDFGRFAPFFRNYNEEPDTFQWFETQKSHDPSFSPTASISYSINSPSGGAFVYQDYSNFNNTAVASSVDNIYASDGTGQPISPTEPDVGQPGGIDVGQYAYASRKSDDTNPITGIAPYYIQKSTNNQWLDEFTWITGGTCKRFMFNVGASTVTYASAVQDVATIGSAANLFVASAWESKIEITGDHEKSHGRPVLSGALVAGGVTPENSSYYQGTAPLAIGGGALGTWSFDNTLYTGSLGDPSGIDYAGNPIYREAIRTWNALGEDAIEWYRGPGGDISSNSLPFLADDHAWNVGQRERNTVWFIDHGPYKGRKSSVIGDADLDFNHCSGEYSPAGYKTSNNYWGADMFHTNQGSGSTVDIDAFRYDEDTSGNSDPTSTNYNPNHGMWDISPVKANGFTVGPQNVHKKNGDGIKYSSDDISIDIGIGGVYTSGQIGGSNSRFNGFWATGFNDGDGNTNESYSSHVDIIKKFYPSQKFRWREDPTGSIYTIQSVSPTGRIRADLGEGMKMSPALQKRNHNSPNPLRGMSISSGDYDDKVPAYARFSDNASANIVHTDNTSIGSSYTGAENYTVNVSDEYHNEDYSYAAAQLSPNFTTNLDTKIVNDDGSADMPWAPFDNSTCGAISSGMKLSITHSSTASNDATNFQSTGYSPYVVVDSLTATDENYGGISRQITVGLILTNYTSTSDDSARTLSTQGGGHVHDATEHGDPLLIWKIEDLDQNPEGGPYRIYLCGYTGMLLGAPTNYAAQILPTVYHDSGSVTVRANDEVYRAQHPIYDGHKPKVSTTMVFQQPLMNGYSQYSCNRINAQHVNRQVYDPEGGVVDGTPCVMPVYYTMEFLEEIGKDEFEMPSNPAIWETEPIESTPLDVYYEASSVSPLVLTLETASVALPIASEVRHHENPSTTMGIDDCVIEGYGEHLNEDDQIAADPDGAGGTLAVGLPGVYIVVGNKQIGQSPLVGGQFIGIGSNLDITKPDGSIVRVLVTGYWGESSGRTTNIYISKELYGPDTSYVLNWHNCYSFGNGVESNRIRDGFNLPFITNGVKASTTVEFSNYKEEHRKYGLIYSGLYNSNSGVNNLNQFIAAEKITKDINPIYGSVQKLYSRDSDLVALCEDRILQILANKDAVFNADNNPQLVATDRVLGTVRPFVGDYGISKNPESFASESYRVYFTDKSRGAVIRLSKDGLTPISEAGMSDWFKDNLKLNKKIIGSYDDRKKEYNVTLTNSEINKSSDITTESPVIELVTNGDFDSNISGWGGTGAAWSTSNASAKATVNDSGDFASIEQNIANFTQPFVVNKAYTVTFKAKSTILGSLIRVQDNTNNTGGLTSSFTQTTLTESWKTYVYNFVANADSNTIAFARDAATAATSGNTWTFYIDDVSIKELSWQNTTSSSLAPSSTTVSFKEDVGGWVSFKSFAPENAISCANNYFTFNNGQVYQHHYENVGKTQYNRNIFYSKQLVVKAVNGITPGFDYLGDTKPKHYFYFDIEDFLAAIPRFVLDSLPQVEDSNGDEIGAVTIDLQTLKFNVYRDHKRIHRNIDITFFERHPGGTPGFITGGLNAGRIEPNVYDGGPRWEVGDVLVCTEIGDDADVPQSVPTRFYNNSSLNVFLNDIPSSVKSFHAIDYEGSQARVEGIKTVEVIGVPPFYDVNGNEHYADLPGYYFEYDATEMIKNIYPEFDHAAGNHTIGINQYRNGVLVFSGEVYLGGIWSHPNPHGRKATGAAIGDWQVGDIITNAVPDLFNSTPADGWFVSGVETDKQQGQILDFIEKEGKWFNYIKGASDVDIQNAEIFNPKDVKARNIQGLGILKQTIFTEAQAEKVWEDNDESGSVSTYLKKGWDYYRNILEFDNGVNTSCQIGDRIYHRISAPDEKAGQLRLFGIVESLTSNTVTVNENVILNFDGSFYNLLDPDAGDFIFFEKSSSINSSNLLGYYADLKFENNSLERAEIFSVSAEITESSK